MFGLLGDFLKPLNPKPESLNPKIWQEQDGGESDVGREDSLRGTTGHPEVSGALPRRGARVGPPLKTHKDPIFENCPCMSKFEGYMGLFPLVLTALNWDYKRGAGTIMSMKDCQ